MKNVYLLLLQTSFNVVKLNKSQCLCLVYPPYVPKTSLAHHRDLCRKAGGTGGKKYRFFTYPMASLYTAPSKDVSKAC